MARRRWQPKAIEARVGGSQAPARGPAFAVEGDRGAGFRGRRCWRCSTAAGVVLPLDAARGRRGGAEGSKEAARARSACGGGRRTAAEDRLEGGGRRTPAGGSRARGRVMLFCRLPAGGGILATRGALAAVARHRRRTAIVAQGSSASTRGARVPLVGPPGPRRSCTEDAATHAAGGGTLAFGAQCAARSSDQARAGWARIGARTAC